MADSGSGSRKFLYAAVCTGNLMAFSAAISLGWTSPVNVKLQNEQRLDENPLGKAITSDEESWIGGLLAVGAFLGPFLAGFSADKFGRKNTLICCCGIPLVVSYLTLAFAKSIALYYAARCLAGFAFGGVFTVLPNFNSEIAEDSIRGAVSSSMNIFVACGPLFSYAVGPYTSIKWFSLACAVWPAIFTVVFYLLVPESPYHLVAIDDMLGAAAALRRFRSASDSKITKELENIKAAVYEAKRTKGSFSDLFKSKALVKALIISLAMVTFQQLSGINSIILYSEKVFKLTGSSIPAEISAIIVGAVQMGTSFVTPLLVDRMGRKVLLVISGIGMIIAEVPMGLYFYLQVSGNDLAPIFWLPIVCFVTFIIAFNFGFGPLPWTVMAEVLPSNVKSAASTATASFCFVLAFLTTKFYFSVSEVIGMSGSFFLFASICMLAVVFVLTYMIETKGRSFQEIQDMLGK